MNPHPKKHFGQHFLTDTKFIDRIIQTLKIKEDDCIVEIGPGQGALTQHLIAKCKDFSAVELDPDMVDYLKRHYPDLKVFHEDATRFDFTKLAEKKPIRLFGNLPYNVSTPILFHVLENADAVEDMLFMLQKEVVQRMCAEPGSKQYGRLSVMVQYRCHAEYCFDVPDVAFSPPPKVHSAIVKLNPYSKTQLPYPKVAIKPLQQLVTQAFSMRRKTLRNALKDYLSTEQMQSLGIDPKARPETLSVAQFAQMALAWQQSKIGK